MRVIRTTQHADTILTAARKGIQSQLEQLTSPDAKFQSGFEHQPIPQSGVRRKGLRKQQCSFRSCLETERQLEVSETPLAASPALQPVAQATERSVRRGSHCPVTILGSLQ